MDDEKLIHALLAYKNRKNIGSDEYFNDLYKNCLRFEALKYVAKDSSYIVYRYNTYVLYNNFPCEVYPILGYIPDMAI